MSNRVSDAPRASGRVIFYEDEQQYTETRRTRRPVRDSYYDEPRYDDRDSRYDERRYDDRPSRYDDRPRYEEDDAPRRRTRGSERSEEPRRAPRSRRDIDAYDDDHPISVKVVKDPPKKTGTTFGGAARKGAVVASRALAILGFGAAVIGGVLAIFGTGVLPGLGSAPNIGHGATVALAGAGTYLGFGALAKTLEGKKEE